MNNIKESIVVRTQKMMRYTWMDFYTKFISRRLFVFILFQLFVLHNYLKPILDFSKGAAYPVSPWCMVFLGSSVYYLIIYGISLLYFFSDIPYTQSEQRYVMIRIGKKKWVLSKIIRIWLSAIALTILEMILGILVLLPNIQWTMEWGKVLYTISMTDMAVDYPIQLYINYALLTNYTPLQAIVLLCGLMIIVTGLIGTFMFVISIMCNRVVAVIITGIITFLPIVFLNNLNINAWISFFSPLTWMNLTMYSIDFWYREAITIKEAFILGGICSIFFAILATIIFIKQDVKLYEDE